jgi:hypothetical protein
MSDNDWYEWPPLPPSLPRPSELLWEFVRESDHPHFRFEIRFHGESYGWEVQVFEGGEFSRGRGAFVTRTLAEQWAAEERKYLAACRT